MPDIKFLDIKFLPNFSTLREEKNRAALETGKKSVKNGLKNAKLGTCASKTLQRNPMSATNFSK